MARWGVSKTTVADIAAEAGCSRATAYRCFPGGKSEIMAAYGRIELATFFAEANRLIAATDSLEEAFVVVITAVARGLAGHRGFQYMLAHEPGLVLPYLGFADIDRLFVQATDALAPAFERFDPTHARPLVEIAARLTLSHAFQPSQSLDLSNADDVRGVVRRHLLPIVGTTEFPFDHEPKQHNHPAHHAVPA